MIYFSTAKTLHFRFLDLFFTTPLLPILFQKTSLCFPYLLVQGEKKPGYLKKKAKLQTSEEKIPHPWVRSPTTLRTFHFRRSLIHENLLRKHPY